MGRLCETEDLTDIQSEILKTVRQFVESEINKWGPVIKAAGQYAD